MPGWLFLLLALLEKYRMGGDLHFHDAHVQKVH